MKTTFTGLLNGLVVTIVLGTAGVPVKPAVASAGNWPQWRGPERTDVSNETGLLKSWPAGGPKRVWLFQNAGRGYSGPAIVGTNLFTIGAREGIEYLLALDAEAGKELWAAKVGEELKNGYGDGPRGTPTVDGERVYAMGGQGSLICANLSDGKVLWQHSMKGFGGGRPHWGYTESVLVDGDKVMCTPGGGKGAIVALNKMDGKLIWQSKEFTDEAQYSSLIAVNHNGVRQYIQLTKEHVVGVAAADGKLRWSADFPGRAAAAVIPTPIFHDGYVYVTAGYGVGCKLVKLGSGNETTEVYLNKVMKNHHGGVILVDGYLYGHSDPGWVCQDFKSGKQVWMERKLGKGAVAYADGMLYCLEESSGTVALVEASPQGWKEHGRFKLEPQSTQRSPSGRIWTHPVITGGRLYLRDQELLSCYDVDAP